MTEPERSAELAALVEGLHDPQTRREARRKLVQAGAAVPLLGCLDSTNESVVWSAVESLGEMRAPEAVDPLIALLARGVLVVDVAEALTRITGQDFGADVSKWRDWLAKAGPSAAAGLNVEDCIRRTAAYLGAEPSGSGSSFRFRLSVDGGRSQKVSVYFGQKDTEGDEIVVVYSECGPAKSKYYEAVLRKNLSIPDGAFAIRDVDGEPHFVMVDTMAAATVTPSGLAKKIEGIASRADSVEKVLTKEDTR